MRTYLSGCFGEVSGLFGVGIPPRVVSPTNSRTNNRDFTWFGINLRPRERFGSGLYFTHSHTDYKAELQESKLNPATI